MVGWLALKCSDSLHWPGMKEMGRKAIFTPAQLYPCEFSFNQRKLYLVGSRKNPLVAHFRKN